MTEFKVVALINHKPTATPSEKSEHHINKENWLVVKKRGTIDECRAFVEQEKAECAKHDNPAWLDWMIESIN